MFRDCKVQEELDDHLWSAALAVPVTPRPGIVLDEIETAVAGMCMSDACPILGVHQAHPVSEREDKFVYTTLTSVQEIAYDCVRDYEAKMFGQIYQDVINAYGEVQSRVVQRALHQLSQDRKIVLVTPRGTRARAKRLDRLYGAYVRWTSPLLFDPDGCLFDQAEDLFRSVRSRRRDCDD